MTVLDFFLPRQFDSDCGLRSTDMNDSRNKLSGSRLEDLLDFFGMTLEEWMEETMRSGMSPREAADLIKMVEEAPSSK